MVGAAVTAYADTLRADPFSLVGTRIGDKYSVESVVEETQFSVVYRATHVVWQRSVAIKALKTASELGPEARARRLASFVREGALLAELSEGGAAVCQARDVASLTTRSRQWVPYMVLEWIDGEPLDALMSRERGVQRSIREAIELLDPIAEALAVAHARSIAHCDVKPSNVVVVADPRDGGRRGKLVDFGLARLVGARAADGADAARSSERAFTPWYAAPEQYDARYGVAGPRTDVYALALIVVELLTGREALRGDDLAVLEAQSCDPRRRPTPRALGAVVADNVERVVACALAVEPAKRFPSAGSFWAALRAAAGASTGETTAPILLTRRLTRPRWPARGRPARRGRRSAALRAVAVAFVLAVFATLAAARVVVPRGQRDHWPLPRWAPALSLLGK
jgi:serine/threonine protein kinase